MISLTNQDKPDFYVNQEKDWKLLANWQFMKLFIVCGPDKPFVHHTQTWWKYSLVMVAAHEEPIWSTDYRPQTISSECGTKVMNCFVSFTPREINKLHEIQLGIGYIVGACVTRKFNDPDFTKFKWISLNLLSEICCVLVVIFCTTKGALQENYYMMKAEGKTSLQLFLKSIKHISQQRLKYSLVATWLHTAVLSWPSGSYWLEAALNTSTLYNFDLSISWPLIKSPVMFNIVSDLSQMITKSSFVAFLVHVLCWWLSRCAASIRGLTLMDFQDMTRWLYFPDDEIALMITNHSVTSILLGTNSWTIYMWCNVSMIPMINFHNMHWNLDKWLHILQIIFPNLLWRQFLYFDLNFT